MSRVGHTSNSSSLETECYPRTPTPTELSFTSDSSLIPSHEGPPPPNPHGIPWNQNPLQLQMPMVEVASGAAAGGTQLVFRPSNPDDLRAAMSHMPTDPTVPDWYDKFMVVCREFRPTETEIRRMLLMKLGPSNFSKIQEYCAGETRLTHPDWADQHNTRYVFMLRLMGQRWQVVFPQKHDMGKVTSTKQKNDETVDEFSSRLKIIFDRNSGLPDPGPTARKSPYESHLMSIFLTNLLPDIRKAVDLSLMDPGSARFDEAVRHAKHAERQMQEKRQKRQHDTDEMTFRLTQLQLAQANQERKGVSHPTPNWHQGRGRGRRPDPPQGRSDACFQCGAADHWARDCPQRRKGHHGRGGHRGRGRGGPQGD